MSRNAVRDGLIAAVLFALAFLVYNANGREIGSYDSQPPKFTAIQIVRSHTLRLDGVIAKIPPLAERPGFARDLQGHFRSAYPPLPGVIAGLIGLGLAATGLFDPTLPGAETILAKIAASTLISAAVSAAYLESRRYIERRKAALVAIGFGFGTNLWTHASQTLWQAETCVLALTLAVWTSDSEEPDLSHRRTCFASLCLGLAGAARAQVSVSAIVLLIYLIGTQRTSIRRVLTIIPAGLCAAATVLTNIHWFGSPLGARAQMEAAASAAHAVSGPFGNPAVGLVGLLFSPSRGLFVFSPIVIIAVVGIWRLRSAPNRFISFCNVAALLQLSVYSSYSAWWGGHTFGPRLLLDVLPLLLPAACVGVDYVATLGRWRAGAWIAFAWSIALAATGAFVYPHDLWNSSPTEVDTHHARLWDWRDPQFVRAWRAGLSPQNFDLFKRP